MGKSQSSPYEGKYLYEPLSLTCAAPLPPGQRVRALVRSRRGKISSRLVIEHVGQVNGSTCAYILDGVLTKHPRTDVVIFLATPARFESSSDSCLVNNGPPVVIKAMPFRGRVSRRFENPLSEVAAMEILSKKGEDGVGGHPNVIPLLDRLQDHEYVYIVMPYIAGGDVFARVASEAGRGMPVAEARKCFKQIAKGLLYMKRHAAMAHHDVSLENVMLSSDGRAQLIDLGFCLQMPSGPGGGPMEDFMLVPPQRCCGKPPYVAPEVAREQPFDPFAADVWSLAACLYSMLTGRCLYNSPKDDAFDVIARGRIREVMTTYEGYGVQLPSEAKDLISLMMQADPRKRLTLEQVLEHPFCSEVEEDAYAATPAGALNATISPCRRSAQ